MLLRVLLPSAAAQKLPMTWFSRLGLSVIAGPDASEELSYLRALSVYRERVGDNWHPSRFSRCHERAATVLM